MEVTWWYSLSTEKRKEIMGDVGFEPIDITPNVIRYLYKQYKNKTESNEILETH